MNITGLGKNNTINLKGTEMNTKNEKSEQDLEKIFDEVQAAIQKASNTKKIFMDDCLMAGAEVMGKYSSMNKYRFNVCEKDRFERNGDAIAKKLEVSPTKILRSFEVYDLYSKSIMMVSIVTGPDVEAEDLIKFGHKEVPVECIEKAYQDMVTLAKAGYVDWDFANQNEYWPGAWAIEPETNKVRFKYSPWIRKVKARYGETAPGFIENYLKSWKEEMLKVNPKGIQRYRYEKYGKVF